MKNKTKEKMTKENKTKGKKTKGKKIKGKKKMVLNFILGIIGLIAAAVLGLFLYWTITGRGEIAPFTDENGNIPEGSIAERTFIDVNGRQNGMIIRGISDKNPVLLFVSGGPGVPEYWLNDSYKEKYPNRIEEEFTVCWWDYRGEGLSYSSDIKPEEITLEQLTEDAIVVCDYLKERFGVEKVYLMAHSAGTMLGLHLAINKPEYFYCYYAMGQNSQPEWGRHEEGYKYMKKYFSDNGMISELNKLEKLVEEKDGHIVLREGCDDGDWEEMLLVAGCATTREMKSDAFGIFFPQMASRCYTISEKINYWKGKALLKNSPYAEESHRIYENIKVDIPIVFISGTYDYTTPITTARELSERIEGPEVVFYEFNNSAHSPLWEENEYVLKVMKKYVR